MEERQFLFNGKLFTESQLKEKYGDTWESAAAERGIEEAYQYNDKVFSASQLKEKYGDDYETVAFDKGIKPFGEKKNQVETDITESESEGGLSELSDEQKRDLGIPFGEGTDEWGIPTAPEETEEERKARQDKNKNFWGASLMGGMSRLNEAIVSIPNTLYNAAAFPQNKLANALELPEDHWLRTDDAEFEETIGVKNSLLDYYQEETKKFSEQKQKYIEENFDSGSIYENIKEGNYEDAFDLLAAGTVESAPISLGIMASGGTFGLARTALGTTVALTEGQKQELKNQFPDATEAELMEKAVMSAAAESVFSAVSTGTIGQVYKDIIKREGKEIGKDVFKRGFIEVYKKALKKYGAPVGAIGEGLEEAATQVTQNLIAERDPMEGVIDAFILGTGSGAVMTAPMNIVNKANQQQTPEGGAIELNIPAELQEQQETPEYLRVDSREGVDKIYEEFQRKYDNLQELEKTGEITKSEKLKAQKMLRESRSQAVKESRVQAPEAQAEVAPVNVERQRAGLYVDKVSNNTIERQGSKWMVKKEIDGEVLHKTNSLREATEWLGNNNQEAMMDDGEVAAQGFGRRQKKRDSSLGEGGPVGDTRGKLKKLNRFMRKTFSSEAGLDRSVVRVVERHRGRLTGINKILEADVRSFGRMMTDLNKQEGKRTLETLGRKKASDKRSKEGLLAINEYLMGNKEADVSFLSEESLDELNNMRERLDTQSRELVESIQDQYGDIDGMIEEQLALVEQKTEEVAAKKIKKGEENKDPDYKALKGMEKRLEALEQKREVMNSIVDTIEGNLGEYLFRSYDAFSDPEYIENITSKTANKEAKRRLNNAVDFVAEDLGVDTDEATEIVLTYLDGLKNKENFISARLDGKMDAPFLKKRKDIPEPIRELLGESKDPIKNYVASYQNITQYLSSIKYQQELSRLIKDLGISSPTMQLGYTQFKTNNQGWDFLEDMYVPVEFAEGMEDLRGLDPINTNWVRYLVGFTGNVKMWKTVLAPTTAFRNFWSGAFLSMNAGFVPFTKNVNQSFAMAWGGKKTQKELREETLKLMELGVIGDGAVSGEITGVLNDMNKEAVDIADKSRYRKAMDTAQRFYALGDDAYKAMGYYVWRDRYLKAGYDTAKAEELAATRIRNGFPTYSKLPKNIQGLRRFPLVGTFPSFSYEVWRTTRNNIEFILKDLRLARETGNTAHRTMAYKQLAGMTAAMVTASLVSYMTKRIFNVGDEDEDAAKNMSPDWQRDSELFFFGTGDGNVTFMDATALFPAETILKPLRILIEEREGRDLDDKVIRALIEAQQPFTGMDILWGTASDIHSNKSSYGQQIYDGKNIGEGLAKEPDKIVDYFMSNAGVGAYNNLKEFARANADNLPNWAVDFFGGKESKYKEYTNTEAVLGLLGFRITTLDYTQGTVNLVKNAREDFRIARNRALTAMKEGRVRSVEEVDNIVNDEEARNKELYEEGLLAVEGYENLGIPPSRLYNSLKAEGISDKNIAAIMAGIAPPIGQIERSDLEKNLTKIEVGRNRNKPDKVKELKVIMIKNAAIFNEKTAERNMRNVAERLYEIYGDGLKNIDKLDKKDRATFNILKSQGLLFEVANKNFGGIEKTYSALDYYKELIKKSSE